MKNFEEWVSESKDPNAAHDFIGAWVDGLKAKGFNCDIRSSSTQLKNGTLDVRISSEKMITDWMKEQGISEKDFSMREKYGAFIGRGERYLIYMREGGGAIRPHGASSDAYRAPTVELGVEWVHKNFMDRALKAVDVNLDKFVKGESMKGFDLNLDEISKGLSPEALSALKKCQQDQPNLYKASVPYVLLGVYKAATKGNLLETGEHYRGSFMIFFDDEKATRSYNRHYVSLSLESRISKGSLNPYIALRYNYMGINTREMPVVNSTSKALKTNMGFSPEEMEILKKLHDPKNLHIVTDLLHEQRGALVSKKFGF